MLKVSCAAGAASSDMMGKLSQDVLMKDGWIAAQWIGVYVYVYTLQVVMGSDGCGTNSWQSRRSVTQGRLDDDGRKWKVGPDLPRNLGSITIRLTVLC